MGSHLNLSWGVLVQVLGGVVDNVLPINEDTADIVKDTLAILSCKVGTAPCCCNNTHCVLHLVAGVTLESNKIYIFNKLYCM